VPKFCQILPKSRGEGSDIKALARLSERFPKRADIALALSDALALTGNLEEATQIAQQAIKQAEQLPALEQARLHYHLGQLLKHNGQLDQALHHLDKAAKVANHLSEIHIERGQVFLARRQHDQALNAFEAASKAAPNDAQPHLQAAMAHKEAKDYVAAEKGLRLAADLAPKDRFIQRQLAALMALNFVHPSETLGNAS
jgi:tetratricopeptide (TPR) repeat protein